MRGVEVGSMLLVPFGSRRLLGVVVELAEESDIPAERLVAPLRALETGVPADLVSLGLWMAEEYCSTPARGLALVLPPGTGTGALPRIGVRRTLAAEITAARREALGADVRLGPRQRAALEALAERSLTAAAVVRAAGCDHSTLRSLEARGLVALEQVELRRRPDLLAVGARGGKPARLTAAQESALAEVVGAMDGGERRLLLQGVTGSGKTEVYLRAVAEALDRGRSAIVLVPEIALTPQTASRFEERFGDAVAVIHSKLGSGERYDEWLRMRRGEARVCVGPRSAAFAPVADLGLVVIDEEHDPSYKQDGDPRYDAREVVRRRAAEGGAAVVAGSATPRPETWLWPRRLELAER